MQIIEKASHKWKPIADLICGHNRASTLDQQFKDPRDCLSEVLRENFVENKPEVYSQDWNGLLELLDDVSLGTLKEDVQYALLHQK